MPSQDGRTPRPVPDVAESRAERRSRAVEGGLDVRLREQLPFVAFDVRNPARGTRYLVVAPSYPLRDGSLCTCTDFSRRGIGTCKHIEAVWLWIEEHPGTAPVPPFPRAETSWEEIEVSRRGAGGRDEATPRSLWVRRAGRLLIESGPDAAPPVR